MEDRAPAGEILLQISNLDTGYAAKNSPVVISREMNASLIKGQFVAILGPNGAGKSTLIKTILGHLAPLSGQIEWQGKSIAKMSVRQIAQRMSAVLTDKIDDRYLSAYDVVSTGRYPYGSLSGKLAQDDKNIILKAMTGTGILSLSERRFYTLSDGEKQKTMIARAIAQQTPLICLDEPTAFIDSPGKVAIMQLLKQLSLDQEIGILLTTHDSELAMQFADELWLISKNQTMETGSPKTLINNGQINHLFDQEGVKFNPDTLRFESEIFRRKP